MSDEKNAQDAQSTERVEELFATRPYESAAEGPAGAASSDAASATAPTATLPDAEPAWLQPRERTERTSPRIRWGGIVWGLVFAATGWFALWTMFAAGRRRAFSEWILTLDGGGWAVVAAFAIGGLLLVVGLIAGLRAATRQR